MTRLELLEGLVVGAARGAVWSALVVGVWVLSGQEPPVIWLEVTLR